MCTSNRIGFYSGRDLKDAVELGDRLVRERKEAAAATAELQEQRAKVEKLSDRVSLLERQLVAQTTEAEVLRRRVQEVNGLTTDRMKVLPEREREIAQLRDKITECQNVEAQLHTDLSSAAARSTAATGSLIKEKAWMEDQLNQAKAESPSFCNLRPTGSARQRSRERRGASKARGYLRRTAA